MWHLWRAHGYPTPRPGIQNKTHTTNEVAKRAAHEYIGNVSDPAPRQRFRRKASRGYEGAPVDSRLKDITASQWNNMIAATLAFFFDSWDAYLLTFDG